MKNKFKLLLLAGVLLHIVMYRQAFHFIETVRVRGAVYVEPVLIDTVYVQNYDKWNKADRDNFRPRIGSSHENKVTGDRNVVIGKK